MFIVTKLVHIKYGYENEIISSLQRYHPSSGTQGFINIESSRMKRTEYGDEYMIRLLWKTQKDYHEWISQKEKDITWKQQFHSYILSSKSNAAYIN
ncbi:hypothetical protein D0U04_13210 [Bacillus clarus]|uniref:Antibiotic biosynthesis monooxygenase family protein n=1 Tax=Bacillus clarus TaxID=2338372 RepID=A0A090Z6H5_9BACI|nr:hypothetical protein [Bacillus clarus]KFM99955.1 hypothetical protein DJ93_3187 [Bacillus clarus]RFT66631.1 hypothetical protein D0U04_13210 [Bacillus clarus]